MIEIAHGNLLHAPVDALVNTVNTEGVMGKGIALQFRRAYPAMFEAYLADCRAGRVKLGHMHVYDLGGARVLRPPLDHQLSNQGALDGAQPFERHSVGAHRFGQDSARTWHSIDRASALGLRARRVELERCAADDRARI
jgi:hypothetical protein